MRAAKERRRAQAGTTLVELLVSLTIIGFALMIVVGVLSDGLLQSSIAKRNVAVQAVTQYELEKISASAYSSAASPYSDCFAVDNTATPVAAPGGYQSTCPAGYSLRADVSWAPYGGGGGLQVWSISVAAQPGSAIGSPVSLYKTAHT